MSYTNRYPKSYQRFASRPVASGPRVFPARFDSVCPECGGKIHADEDLIVWEPGKKAVHQVCPQVTVQDAVYEGAEAQALLRTAEARGLYQPAPALSAPVAPVARLEVEDAGVYKLPDGAIVKVQANREKTKVYAKRLVEHKGISRATEAGERVHAEYVYEAGLIAQVSREGVKLSLEEAKALTIRYGFCIRCGRHLKAAQSVEQGMGPVCITYFS